MTTFPAGLVEWSGNRSGGVRRVFDDNSGRPSGTVIQTSLLVRLHEWAWAIAEGQSSVPRAILLVGGPGNGKTEAIESTIGALDIALGANGSLIGGLRDAFFPPEGKPVQRVARTQAGRSSNADNPFSLVVVQDASTVAGFPGKTAAQLLLDELEEFTAQGNSAAYLCCVNRGILDDALIEAAEAGRAGVETVMQAITSSISVSANAPSCWPLDGFPQVAVWPMDAESLMSPAESDGMAPARAILDRALDAGSWAPLGSCAAGTGCPFCTSRNILSQERESTSLVSMLRWHEVGEGKRWSFRDLFSLTSYLLAGHRNGLGDSSMTPCEWAAKQWRLDERAKKGEKPSIEKSSAIFELVAAQYQHALFHHWDVDQVQGLRKAIRELELDDNNVAMGLHWFLKSRKSSYLPTMIAKQLDGMSRLLDPAMTDPDEAFQLDDGTSVRLREIDIRFSRSILEGIDFVTPFGILTPLETELLSRLNQLDADLSRSLARRKRPATATSLQRLARDFSCRIVRRSIGCRLALVPDRDTLEQFREVLEDGSGHVLDEVARELENLLNSPTGFEISLTTTFGQPMPPVGMRATLVVALPQQVNPIDRNIVGRPPRPISFLSFGDGESAQPIALTYDLFKAMKELEKGMSVASLPAGVFALLDTAKARLAGPIVRSTKMLDRSHIALSTSDKEVHPRRGGFVFAEKQRS